MSFTSKNQLPACLKKKNLRQSQLAWHLNMSRAYVSRLCSGQIEPSIIPALRIARYLKMPVEEIFQFIEVETKVNNFPAAFPSAAGTNQ